MNRLHRRNSSTSSTASVDFTSGERLQFNFSGLQALQVPKGWDKLSVSIISVETGKTLAKTGKASVQNGNCQWTENLSEYIWVPHDDASKVVEQCLYKLLISMGSGRSGILGEVTVNLSNHLNSETSISIAEPLKNCSHGTILQVEIRCLTPRANPRNDGWVDTDSFTEDTNASDDLDNTSDASDGRITKRVVQDRSLSTGGSRSSFDSMDDSFGRESFSPHRNLSGVIGIQDSVSSSNSTQYSSYNVYDSPKSIRSPYGSGKHNLSQRQDSGKVSHFVPASPLRTSGSIEFVPESEGATMEELRAESRMWERNARKLKIDLDFTKKESRDQTRRLENASMEVVALQTECDGLKDEISYLKALLAEAEVKEEAADNLKLQDKDDMRTELEEEIKFQRDLNDNLSMQLNKTQESNLELVSVLQELEETIEQQKLSLKDEQVLKAQILLDYESEWMKKLSLKDEEILNLKEKLSAQIPKEIPDPVEVQALKDKIQELESDCNELAGENLDLLLKLKESSKDLDSKSPSIEDSEIIKLESQIQQLKEEAKKREVDGIDAGYLQIRCNDLESKCVELEVNIQGFKDKACYLDDELNKYRAKAEEQENEVAALKRLLKLQQEGSHENSFNREGCTEVGMARDNVQLGGQINTMMMESSLNGNTDMPEKLNMELKSRVDDLGKELLEKSSEIEVLKSDCLTKDKEIERQSCYQKDLETQLSKLQTLHSQLKGSMKAMQSDSTIISECLEKVKSDMVVLSGIKDSQVAANKILEKKVLELQSCNKELELHLSEMEVENIHLSERISGLEPQLRYLTDARESSRLELHHSETRVTNLQADIKKLEEEMETNKADMRLKLENMQKRWLEAQEECEYLKKANPKLQTTAENLIEESSQLQKSNRELKQQRLDLYNRCMALEAELKESQHNFSKLSKNLEDLEGKFSLMITGIAEKEKTFDSEIEALHFVNEEQTEKLNMFNQMYLEKMVEIDNFQQETAHLSTQIYATQDERERMGSEAVLEMHVENFKTSEKKLHTIQVEYEARIQELTVELAASKQNHGVLEANLEKMMELLENTRFDEEKLRIKVAELDGNLKRSEYERVQLTEEISSLEAQLKKIPVLQDEVVALKNELNVVKYENERLEASLQLITGDYEELKEAKSILFQRTLSMQKAVDESEDHKRSKFALEEQIMRLQGDLTAREALSAQEAEMKNEVGRLKRSNSQLQWKINCLQEEKDECIKNAQVLEEKLELIESSATNSPVSFVSDSMKLSEDVEGINKEHDKDAALLEAELKELQERYLHMSLKYAEVEAQREELVIKLKAERPGTGRSWFS
ncbi:hypothetical protein L2E82_32879 [Cichorium intybus]|uniref:Uncharacterized protein n=1 Tax=Cichorium intybus TaxID=13427 RepID=A0ACB9BIH8_CICIN|nr:hypothetical protein L2E82_32879 [Cichorium intybus]